MWGKSISPKKESKCKDLAVKEPDNLRRPEKAFVAGPQ